VTTCLENLEISRNLTAAKEMSGYYQKFWETLKVLGKIFAKRKTVSCKLYVQGYASI